MYPVIQRVTYRESRTLIAFIYAKFKVKTGASLGHISVVKSIHIRLLIVDVLHRVYFVKSSVAI